MKLKLFLLPLLAVLLSVSFYSCSEEAEFKSGKEQVEHIKSIIYENGEIIFTKIDNAEDQYIIGASEAKKAENFCNRLLNFQWNGKKYTYTLNDKMGSVVITPNPQKGIYIRLIFGVEGIPTFTLDIVSKAYLDNNNLHVGIRPML